MTFSSPCCESCSTSRRYLGSRPAWWMPMPARIRRESSLPYGLSKREVAERRGDLVALGAGRDGDAGQALRQLGRLALREADHVDRRLPRPRAGPPPSRAAASRGTRSRAAPGARSECDQRDRAARALPRGRSGSRACRRASPTSAGTSVSAARSSGTCQAKPRSGRRRSGTRRAPRRAPAASAPRRSAMLASTSAVQQTIGAAGLMLASPVSMPTFSAPKASHSAKNFSETSALIGEV